MFDAVIIGGGAAGLACAITAARRGKSVALVERNGEFGKKILATGNGRCNLSNLDLGPENYHGASKEFVAPAISEFGEKELAEFFASLGMPLTAWEDGRIFPHSLQAKTVVRALVEGAREAGVQMMPDFYCKGAEETEAGFVVTRFDNQTVEGKSLVLATGGASMKKSGSDGNGYALAERFSHRIRSTFPGIVALTLKGRLHKTLDGVKIPSACTLWIEGRKVREDHGDILFTSYGLSGPPILQQSRHVLQALQEGKQTRVTVTLLRREWSDTQTLYRFLKGRSGPVKEVLSFILNDRIPAPLLQSVGLRHDVEMASLKHTEIQRLIQALQGWEFEPAGSRPLEHAQVTCGGVDTQELDPNTMESKIVKDLYCIGEIADVDGDCGGYNLHWAFASGILCANAL